MTLSYETVEVPFKTRGNRRYLACQQLMEDKDLWEFVLRFSDSFEFDMAAAVWWFKEPELVN